ncbi:twin-arginine translocation protein TatB [Roseobacter sp. AzwK-3b]|uniref:Sec-independent protein translocase protein TatB n=1 Tax=Roseobacter sp. AzwK-3b TaxID=351016 RepID=UPI0001569BF2|nr:Sec-independent protein translocase protein TatB [Roseobacter sp. AzwK-3b]EDM71948.1 twin-arginine translocation protein TatB [Roseobacter sp. AzwK-3b]
MFDLGWTELLVIGVVALIVVGPKDLPGMFRTVGNFVGKAKGMARDFSKAMNDAADEAGVRDVSNTFKKASNPIGSAMDEVKKTAKEATDSFTQDTMAGPKKSRLSEERQAQADKIRQKSAEVAEARLAKEAQARADAEAASDAPKAPAQPAAPKTAAKPAAKPATTTAKAATKTAKPAAKATKTAKTTKSTKAAKDQPAGSSSEDKA